MKIVEFALDKIRFPIFRGSNDFRWINAQQFVCHCYGGRDQLAFKSTIEKTKMSKLVKCLILICLLALACVLVMM